MKRIMETERLRLREMTEEDAPFMYKLLNSPGWLKFIGDRNIQSIDDARDHIIEKYISMYDRFGFGLWLVEIKYQSIPIGTCGLIKRPELEDVDIGFAFLPEFTGQGYAYEAAKATMQYGEDQLKLERIVAITIPQNSRSINLLKKLGLEMTGNAGIPKDKDCVIFEPRAR